MFHNRHSSSFYGAASIGCRHWTYQVVKTHTAAVLYERNRNGSNGRFAESLPAAIGNSTVVREARILAVGDKIKNGKPSAAALQQAKSNGWVILDSGNAPIEP